MRNLWKQCENLQNGHRENVQNGPLYILQYKFNDHVQVLSCNFLTFKSLFKVESTKISNVYNFVLFSMQYFDSNQCFVFVTRLFDFRKGAKYPCNANEKNFPTICSTFLYVKTSNSRVKITKHFVRIGLLRSYEPKLKREMTDKKEIKTKTRAQ